MGNSTEKVKSSNAVLLPRSVNSVSMTFGWTQLVRNPHHDPRQDPFFFLNRPAPRASFGPYCRACGVAKRIRACESHEACAPGAKADRNKKSPLRPDSEICKFIAGPVSIHRKAPQAPSGRLGLTWPDSPPTQGPRDSRAQPSRYAELLLTNGRTRPSRSPPCRLPHLAPITGSRLVVARATAAPQRLHQPRRRGNVQ